MSDLYPVELKKIKAKQKNKIHIQSGRDLHGNGARVVAVAWQDGVNLVVCEVAGWAGPLHPLTFYFSREMTQATQTCSKSVLLLNN